MSGAQEAAGGPGPGERSAIVRYGPGVPAVLPEGAAGPTAEEVWRRELPGERRRRRRGQAWRIVSLVVSAALIVASAVVIYLRLHHPPLKITGVSIARRVKSGCTAEVTALIRTNGGPGTIAYEWQFTPSLEAAQSLRQSVAAGQSQVYLTEELEGQGHGSLTQTVTLRVLSPGQGSASVPVDISC